VLFGYPFYFDSTWLILIPGILLAIFAQARVNGVFNKYSQIKSYGGWTASAAARRMLDENALDGVPIRPAQGRLSDNYDPRRKVLNLSRPVYGSQSLAALGVAAHEVGHALQHRQGYAPMALRSFLVPVANIGSFAAWPLLIAGLLLAMPVLVDIGIAVFGAAVLFQVVTLPVEFDASRRGLALLREGGFLQEEELAGARKVLSAAALTYLAATLMAVLQLLRLLLIANGGRRRD
jgi:Zn-dependent membrane protease YugP